jgi:outer membrane protein assembly factor BamB
MWWRTNLGTTTAACGHGEATHGVTSSPAARRGVIYLGGGDASWYALKAATGQVLWTVPTGGNSASSGHYNWSSPALYDGHAYVGIASFCDSPLVQGELLRVNLATRAIQNVWKAVPDGRVGATIWTSPVVDRATNTVFVTTGNGRGPRERFAEAIVALNATSLRVRGFWALRGRAQHIDSDWGTTPTLFSDSRGRDLVAAINKNGIAYAFRRANLSAGPVWQVRIAQAGTCPNCGYGSVSTPVFTEGRLFLAGGKTTIHGRAYAGAIRAVDPRTGRVLWSRGLNSTVLAALTAKTGMVVVPESDGTLSVLRARTGALLDRNRLPRTIGTAAILGAPTIADGTLYIGGGDGTVHAFAFPAR